MKLISEKIYFMHIKIYCLNKLTKIINYDQYREIFFDFFMNMKYQIFFNN